MEGMSPKITGNDPNLSSELPFALPIDGKWSVINSSPLYIVPVDWPAKSLIE